MGVARASSPVLGTIGLEVLSNVGLVCLRSCGLSSTTENVQGWLVIGFPKNLQCVEVNVKFRRKTAKTLSGQPWSGFRPVMYKLDWKQVGKLSVKMNATGEEVSLSVLEAFTQVRDAGVKIDELEMGTDLVVKIGAQEQRISGPLFNLELLNAILRLHTKGVDAFNARWFWYDSDSVLSRSSQHRYSFFVVFNDAIVQEDVSFWQSSSSGFDPAVFSTDYWSTDYMLYSMRHNEIFWTEAQAKFWYNKFYTETKTGRLMVLRPDEPELFYFPKLPSSPNAMLHTNGWLRMLPMIAGSACVYFWSGSVLAGVAALIFFIFAFTMPPELAAYLLYEMRANTHTLHCVLFEMQSRSFDGNAHRNDGQHVT